MSGFDRLRSASVRGGVDDGAHLSRSEYSKSSYFWTRSHRWERVTTRGASVILAAIHRSNAQVGRTRLRSRLRLPFPIADCGRPKRVGC